MHAIFKKIFINFFYLIDIFNLNSYVILMHKLNESITIN